MSTRMSTRMCPRLLVLCPGQGGQHEGMNDMALGDTAAGAFLAGVALPDGSLFDNRVAQPAVVASTLAMWLALRPRMAALRLAPSLVAGYSVGELSAYAVAGAIEPAAAVGLAHGRARLMDAAAAGLAQTLAAVGGMAATTVRACAAAHGFDLAIVNGHDSVVIGGPAAALPALQAQLQAQGARVQRLPVTVAAHTPLLAGAVQPFAALLAAAPFAPLACPVLAGVDAGAVSNSAVAVDALSRQLAATIHWADCMDAVAEAGITIALELGPGAALARMLQARYPHIACRSVAEFRSIDGILTWLGRGLE